MAGYNAREKLEEKAERLNADIQEPAPNELFIDLDCVGDQYVLEALLPLGVQNGFPLEIVEVRKSQGGNKHAIVRAPRDLSPIERIGLQAMLGSDRKREFVSFLRLEAGEPASAQTVFFRARRAQPGEEV